MVLNMSHEDKEKYRKSLETRNIRTRRKRASVLSDKTKELVYKKFKSNPSAKSSEEISIDEHMKMNDNWMRTGPYKPKMKG